MHAAPTRPRVGVVGFQDPPSRRSPARLSTPVGVDPPEADLPPHRLHAPTSAWGSAADWGTPRSKRSSPRWVPLLRRDRGRRRGRSARLKRVVTAAAPAIVENLWAGRYTTRYE